MRTRSTIQDLLMQFKSQTGSDEQTARRYLENQQWNLSSAIHTFFQEHSIPVSNISEDNEASSRDTPIMIVPRARRESLANLTGSSRGILSSMMLQARIERKWVLIGLQDFSLESYNFDNEVWKALKTLEILNCNFISRQFGHNFGHEFDDIVDNYKVNKFPAILLIDSVTGELLDSLRHLKSIQSVLEDLLLFLEKNTFEQVYPENNQVNEAFSSINSIESNVVTDPEKSITGRKNISATKRSFHPDEPEYGTTSHHQFDDQDKKFKTSSSESASSSLLKNINEMSIKEKNVDSQPLNLAFKLPDGGRKVFHLTSDSTVNDLKILIEALNLKDAQLKLTPNGASVLDYPSPTKLSNVGLSNNTILYVDES